MPSLATSLDGLAVHGSAPLWTPAQGTGVIGWWDGAGRSAGTLSTWDDASPADHDAIVPSGAAFTAPTVRENALNGKSVVRFGAAGGNQTGLRAPTGLTVAHAHTLFLLARPWDLTYPGRVMGGVYTGMPFSGGETNNWLIGWHGAHKNVAYASGWISSSQSVDWDTAWSMYATDGDGSKNHFWIEGVDDLAQWDGGGSGQSPGGALAFGGYEGSGVAEFCNCEIAEAILLDHKATATERQRYEGYLAAKWGRQSALPSDHPYKASAP